MPLFGRKKAAASTAAAPSTLAPATQSLAAPGYLPAGATTVIPDHRWTQWESYINLKANAPNHWVTKQTVAEPKTNTTVATANAASVLAKGGAGAADAFVHQAVPMVDRHHTTLIISPPTSFGSYAPMSSCGYYGNQQNLWLDRRAGAAVY